MTRGSATATLPLVVPILGSRLSSKKAVDAADRIVNVGAGTGSYEPLDRRVIAVEPSGVMIAQRPPQAAPAVQAMAEALPFADRTFDAAMTILTIHHWSDVARGIAELRRVTTERIAVLTLDSEFDRDFWLSKRYFPAFDAWDAVQFTPIERLCNLLGETVVVPVPIPHDCEDGFLGAFWRRPNAYLESDVRSGISAFALIDDEALR